MVWIVFIDFMWYSKNMATSREELAAWRHNVRDNQIGGENDGISPEVAEDLGFRPPEIVSHAGSSAMIATDSEPKRAHRSKRGLSMTPEAIRARDYRKRLRREEDERAQREKGPFNIEFGGR